MTSTLLRLPIIACGVIVSCLLGGCGQKGPLFLPAPAEETATQGTEQSEDEEEQDQEAAN